MADVAERCGAKVTKVERPWGEVFSVADLKDALAKAKPKVVGIVMAETSTACSPTAGRNFAACPRCWGVAACRYGDGTGRHSG